SSDRNHGSAAPPAYGARHRNGGAGSPWTGPAAREQSAVISQPGVGTHASQTGAACVPSGTLPDRRRLTDDCSLLTGRPPLRGELLHLLPERLAPLRVVAEHVEARTPGRQHDRAAGRRQREPG